MPGIGPAHRRRRSAAVAGATQPSGTARVSVNTADRRDRASLMTDATERRRTPTRRGELVVVTGMTGAGRSTAAKELEDLGCFVVDNLPPQLLRRRGPSWSTSRSGTDAADRRRGRRARPASFFDVAAGERSPSGATGRRTDAALPRGHRRRAGPPPEAARRPHPLQGGGRLLDGMRREREVLRRPARRRRPGHRHLQPQRPPAHRPRSREAFGDRPTRPRLQVTVVSFGFKYGIPVDADFVADMRFLPNPLLGARAAAAAPAATPTVADYVMGQPGAAGVPRRATSRCSRPSADGLPRARASAS